MGIGFESPEAAQEELDKILIAYEKWHSTNEIHWENIDMYPAFLIGTDWRVKEIKLKKTR